MSEKKQQTKNGDAKKTYLLGASVALNLAVLAFWASSNDGGGTLASILGTASLMSRIHHEQQGDDWTRMAASQVQLAASFNCSGHGYVYAETLFPNNDQQQEEISCECEDCFTGSFCEHRVANCPANVDGGDPLVFLPYWRQNSEASSFVIPGWYRMGYDFTNVVIPALEREIKAMHKLVGNAVTEGRYIVTGVGETQIAIAVFAAFSMEAQGLPLNVVSDPPYYDAFERQVKTLKPGSAIWGVPSDLGNNGATLEMVISPNNPDGSMRHKVVTDPKAWTVYDHAYYWPHYTPITEAADEDFMMFTLSKLTGHAGTRLGWAIIKDFSMYQKVMTCLRLNSVKVPHETQLRAAHLLRSVREGYAKAGNPTLGKPPMEYAAQQHIFHYGHAKLKNRWDRMIQVFQGSDRFQFDQDFEPKYCHFFKQYVRPNPAFAWIQSLRQENPSTVSVFEEAGIFGRGGARCGMTDQYVRLAMMSSDEAFENLLDHLQPLVNKPPF